VDRVFRMPSKRMDRLTGNAAIRDCFGERRRTQIQHQLGHVLGAVIDVRFTPDATKLLRSSEMTRCANHGNHPSSALNRN